jgi:hypothetical protein
LAIYGGSIYKVGSSIYENANNCVFYENHAKEDAGSIYIKDNSTYANS